MLNALATLGLCFLSFFGGMVFAAYAESLEDTSSDEKLGSL